MYEYLFFRHFYEDGKIEPKVRLTGILNLGAFQPGEVRRYRTTIAPGLYAPVHQHFFVAHMDMAVGCKPGEAFHQEMDQTTIQQDSAKQRPAQNQERKSHQATFARTRRKRWQLHRCYQTALLRNLSKERRPGNVRNRTICLNFTTNSMYFAYQVCIFWI